LKWDECWSRSTKTTKKCPWQACRTRGNVVIASAGTPAVEVRRGRASGTMSTAAGNGWRRVRAGKFEHQHAVERIP
jgi:hypothetical protein